MNLIEMCVFIQRTRVKNLARGGYPENENTRDTQLNTVDIHAKLQTHMVALRERRLSWELVGHICRQMPPQTLFARET